jgi:hypothetical protein
MSKLEDVTRILAQPCIVDNTVLVNFVHAGAADLLTAITQGHLYLPPAILDPAEVQEPLSTWESFVPRSEVLRPLHRARELERQHEKLPEPGQVSDDLRHYRRIAPHLEAFARRLGERWLPAEPTPDESRLAASLASKNVRQPARAKCPQLKGRVELDAGEAEVAAVAVKRGWTMLIDDQAAVQLVNCLYPQVPIFRTCGLLRHAVERGLLPCADAADLFNHVISEELGFYARAGGQRLWLRCDPVRCEWA